jgi:hypothetical protein
VARWLAKTCAFSALLRAHVPCDVRIGVEVCSWCLAPFGASDLMLHLFE